jgi:hypothetical protein
MEERWGPLPPDVKVMALIDHGFYRGWHFAGGGCGGLHKLWKDRVANHEVYLRYEPTPAKEM